MLDLGIKLNFEIQKIDYPIVVKKENICLHCGSRGTLRMVDKFGAITKKEIYPYEHIECINCKRIYSIDWREDAEKDRLYPVAVSPNLKSQILNSIASDKEKRDKEI
jgi:hypothetical protein